MLSPPATPEDSSSPNGRPDPWVNSAIGGGSPVMSTVPLKKRKHVLECNFNQTLDLSSSAVPFISAQPESPQDLSILISPPHTPPIQITNIYNNFNHHSLFHSQHLNHCSPTSSSACEYSSNTIHSSTYHNLESPTPSESPVESNKYALSPSPSESRPFSHENHVTASYASDAHAPSTSFSLPQSNLHLRTHLPEEVTNFSPEKLFSNEATSIVKSKPKKKEKKFVYFIGIKPINLSSKTSLTGGRRSKHVSQSHQNLNHITGFEHQNSNYGCSTSSNEQNNSDSSYHFQQSKKMNYNHNVDHQNRIPNIIDLEDDNSNCSYDLSDQNSYNQSNKTPKKKTQECRFCSNHGKYLPVKGHKYNCEHRNCECKYCLVTRKRRVAVRDQQKQTRHQLAMRQQQENQQRLVHQDQDVVNISDYSPPPQSFRAEIEPVTYDTTQYAQHNSFAGDIRHEEQLVNSSFLIDQRNVPQNSEYNRYGT